MKSESRTEPRTADHEAIAQRAYEQYLARGCKDGCDVEDWLTAETQLLQEWTGGGQDAVSRSPAQPSPTNQAAGVRAG